MTTTAAASEPLLKEGGQAFQEEPAFAGVAVEPVLVAERRLVVVGEGRLGLDPLGAEPLDPGAWCAAGAGRRCQR